MRIIGLTGGIACGQIDGFRRFAGAGRAHCRRGRALPGADRPRRPALPALRDAFGDGVFLPDGTLNRRALAEVIFRDDDARRTLDGLMQPMLRRLIEARIRQFREAAAPCACSICPFCTRRGWTRCATRSGASRCPGPCSSSG